MMVETRIMNGKARPVARLSELLPAAINQSSPLKRMYAIAKAHFSIIHPSIGRLGRLYRGGLTEDAHRIEIGSIEGLRDGKLPKMLSMPVLMEV